MAVIRQVFNAASDHDFFDGKNPVLKVKKPINPQGEKRQRFLTEEDVDVLLEVSNAFDRACDAFGINDNASGSKDRSSVFFFVKSIELMLSIMLFLFSDIQSRLKLLGKTGALLQISIFIASCFHIEGKT